MNSIFEFIKLQMNHIVAEYNSMNWTDFSNIDDTTLFAILLKEFENKVAQTTP